MSSHVICVGWKFDSTENLMNHIKTLAKELKSEIGRKRGREEKKALDEPAAKRAKLESGEVKHVSQEAVDEESGETDKVEALDLLINDWDDPYSDDLRRALKTIFQIKGDFHQVTLPHHPISQEVLALKWNKGPERNDWEELDWEDFNPKSERVKTIGKLLRIPDDIKCGVFMVNDPGEDG